METSRRIAALKKALKDGVNPDLTLAEYIRLLESTEKKEKRIITLRLRETFLADALFHTRINDLRRRNRIGRLVEWIEWELGILEGK